MISSWVKAVMTCHMYPEYTDRMVLCELYAHNDAEDDLMFDNNCDTEEDLGEAAIDATIQDLATDSGARESDTQPEARSSLPLECMFENLQIEEEDEKEWGSGADKILQAFKGRECDSYAVRSLLCAKRLKGRSVFARNSLDCASVAVHHGWAIALHCWGRHLEGIPSNSGLFYVLGHDGSSVTISVYR